MRWLLPSPGRALRALATAALAVALTGAPRWAAETREAPHRCHCPARAHDCTCPVCGARAARGAPPRASAAPRQALGCRCGSEVARQALSGGEPYDLPSAAAPALPAASVGRRAAPAAHRGRTPEPELPPPRAA
jgi:hypothetical protein